MSDNFTGATFANQKVLPSYDGAIRQALLTDGILSGCTLSYSGSTLTMTSGQLMICGRQVIHPAAQNWAITEATSGYARLVLTVDLSRTSTKENFDQVVDAIEYATSVNGFAALTQSDINAAGATYQIVVCVVALGSGGITQIVSRLGEASARADLKTQPVTTSGTNLNNYTATGIYFFSGSVTPTNIPGGTNGWLIVLNATGENISTAYVKQIFLRAGTPGSNDFYIWARTKANGGNWGSWCKLLMNTLVSGEYGTSLPAAGSPGRIYFKKVTT